MTRTPEDDRDISKARYELGRIVAREKAARNQREADMLEKYGTRKLRPVKKEAKP